MASTQQTSDSLDQAVADLILAIKSKDIAKICNAYQKHDDSARAAQLKFCFETANSQPNNYEHYQNIAAQCIVAHGLPSGVIAGLNNSDRVTFFMPALQACEAFSQTNHQGNTFLHALFANAEHALPPFNYIRSLLLFESNEALVQALRSRNQHNLTPIECYFIYNLRTTAMPEHELTALFALIEAERADDSQPDIRNIKHVKSVLQKLSFDKNNQQLLVIASYYQTPVESIYHLH
ncbi:hypothetical protein [Pseudoalteromonas luteoviolacea]|uniref:Orphan protein n=1 Tax=Pseudoalteromonas luteoviolacea NCIMB 1942 TaxID=1365253 RepID=A0A167I3N7_9GAMM|nr:hypothetical protein [Pseudoalteromonas luteoviolacea]KZN58854.1 hypothetical protein N482_00275 [Pseudoalteromonas luteoviolacea NCIMB 1942]KZW99118.1 hypothetical protein JL49_19200 [Pseudoalteromonas luteoviolacea]